MREDEQPTIYTRTGDDGTTALVDGGRVAKGHDRIEAYGAAEELNAAIGVALEQMRSAPPTILYRVAPCLTRVQNQLYDLCSELATPPHVWQPCMPGVQQHYVEAMEHLMDRCSADVPPLRSHVLPGGGMGSAQLHLCRSVCRRAERAVLCLAQKEVVRPEALMYLNRLGDLLFVLARWVQLHAGDPEVPWQPQGTPMPLEAPLPVPVEDENASSGPGFQRIH